MKRKGKEGVRGVEGRTKKACIKPLENTPYTMKRVRLAGFKGRRGDKQGKEPHQTANSKWRRSIKKMTSSRKVIPFFHARDEGHTVIRDVLRLMCYSQGSIFMAPLSSMEAQRPMIDGCSGVLLSLRVEKRRRRKVCQEWSLCMWDRVT